MSENQLTVVQEVRRKLDIMTPELRAVLPAHVEAAAFIRVAQTAINSNAGLQRCTPKSLIAACAKGAEMGLLPDGEQAAIVDYGGTAKFMPMVAGLRDLVRRSGQVKDWKARVVFEGDEFDYVDGDEERLVHKPAFVSGARPKLVYSIAYLENGEISRNVMRMDEVDAIRKRSRSGGSGPWVTDYLQMALKTCLRRHYKALPRAKDDLVRQRMSAAVSAFDDAEGPEDITPQPIESKPAYALEAATERMQAAIQESPFEEIERPAQLTADSPEVQAARQPRKRKTAAEKLAEVEEGNRQRAEAAAAKAAEKAAPKPEEERKPINWREGDAMPDDLREPAADGRDLAYEAACGANSPNDAVLDALDDSSEEDPDAAAYRDGFSKRMTGKVRVPDRELCQDQGTASAWLQGFDEAHARCAAGTAPKSFQEMEAALDEIVNRVFS